MLKELWGRIAAPIDIAKPRTVLKAPQKLLLGIGEVLVYPVCKGAPTNPYAIGKNWAWVKAWQQDGWGAFVVVERGHAFDFLAWYRPLVIAEPLSDEPTLVELGPAAHVAVAEPGHADGSPPRKHVAEFGWARVDRSVQISGVFSPTWIGGISAVNDISVCNNINVRPLDVHEAHRVKHGYPPTPRINVLADIAGVD